MKNLLLPALCLALIQTTVSCNPSDSQNDQNTQSSSQTQSTSQSRSASPNAVAKDFLEAFAMERDLKRAYTFFSSQDQQAKSEAEYIKEKDQGEWEPILKKFNSYSLKNSEITADRASIDIEVQTIDIGQLIQEAMGNTNLLALAAMSEKEQTELAEKNLAVYTSGEKTPPMTRAEDTLQLIKENGEWKIFADWASTQAKAAAKKVTRKVGEEGVLMHDADKGDVLLKVNAVRFTTQKAPAGQAYCIVNITLTNAMESQFTESFVTPTASSFLTSGQGSKYVKDHFPPPGLNTKQLDNLSPLNPGKTRNGDLVFAVDKNATDLVLQFDAGHSPIPEDYSYENGKTLSFKLGQVAL